MIVIKVAECCNLAPAIFCQLHHLAVNFCQSLSTQSSLCWLHQTCSTHYYKTTAICVPNDNPPLKSNYNQISNNIMKLVMHTDIQEPVKCLYNSKALMYNMCMLVSILCHCCLFSQNIVMVLIMDFI